MNNKDSESRIRGSDYQSEAEHNGKVRFPDTFT